MADFLERMAESSRERVRKARVRVSEQALLQALSACAPPVPLSLGSFDIIAELKIRSPARGVLAGSGFDRSSQLSAYSKGGACAVSVLTEPEAFHGSLEDLAQASRLLGDQGLPTMRKDFLTEPYQVLEARAHGASGVLVIVTMLDDRQVEDIMSAAKEQGLFVLLEGFTREDLRRIAAIDTSGFAQPVLAGVNCRDLKSLDVDFKNFGRLADALPRQMPTVAESGVAGTDGVASVAALGYRLALVGSSLMQAADPAAFLAELLSAGRRAAQSVQQSVQ